MIKYLAALLVLISNVANATPACQPFTRTEYETKIIKGSDIIALVTVKDHSNDPYLANAWTDVEIDKVYKGSLKEKSIRIKNWQSVQDVMFNYPKGSEAIAFLKKDSGGYILTDDSYKLGCFPSWVNVDSTIAPKWKENGGRIPLNEAEKLFK